MLGLRLTPGRLEVDMRYAPRPRGGSKKCIHEGSAIYTVGVLEFRSGVSTCWILPGVGIVAKGAHNYRVETLLGSLKNQRAPTDSNIR